MLIFNIKVPLSTTGEEKMAGAASPGESWPPCDSRHISFLINGFYHSL
jgi:hypothetical protein